MADDTKRTYQDKTSFDMIFYISKKISILADEKNKYQLQKYHFILHPPCKELLCSLLLATKHTIPGNLLSVKF